MNKLKLTCVAAALGVVSAGANALLITDWGYLNDAGFTDYTTSKDAIDDTGITATGTTDPAFNLGFTQDANAGIATSIAWGTPYKAKNPDEKQSAIIVDGAKSGTVTTSVVDGIAAGTGVDWAEGTGLRHENWGVTGDTLVGATLLDGLFLDPLAPTEAAFLPALPAPALSFEVMFHETYNHNDAGDEGTMCPYSAVGGDKRSGYTGVNVNGCADLFVIVIPEEVSYTQDDEYTYLSNDFQLPDFGIGLDEYVYTLTTRLSGVTIIEGVSCGDGSTCLGLLTVEDQSNTLEAAFAVAATRVSEPGTLAIFGLGLFGLAAARRRRS